jgi:hypothetical protein
MLIEHFSLFPFKTLKTNVKDVAYKVHDESVERLNATLESLIALSLVR